jgi:hypothetical protein
MDFKSEIIVTVKMTESQALAIVYAFFHCISDGEEYPELLELAQCLAGGLNIDIQL